MALQTKAAFNREDLLSTIGRRLWSYDPVRSRDLPLDLNLSEEAVLTVRGFAPTLTIKEAILDIAGSVAGVKQVIDELVADPALEVEIAEALAVKNTTRHLEPGDIQVFAQLGAVVLVGDLKESDRQAVIQVVEAVPGVRQVVDRMKG